MKTFLRVLSVLCLVSWMGLIFYFSSQTANESSAVSGGVIEIVAEKIYPEFNEMNPVQKKEFIESLQSVVRTFAHYGIYIGLGFFAFLSFISYVGIKYKTRLFLVFSVGAVYSLTDEIHQNFVIGRSMQLIDIAVDCLGVITAIIICSLFVAAIPPLRRKVKYRDKNKELVNLTNDLYEKLDDSLYLQKQMENEIKRYKMMENKTKEEVKAENIEEIPQKETPKFSEDFEFASYIIGKVVVESTKICNQLTLDNQTAERYELVNLILGRTEVLKAEILKILNSETEFETKKELMKSEQNSAYDYFNSIKAQIS